MVKNQDLVDIVQMECSVMELWGTAQGAVIEAIRPRTSGRAVDAHVVRSQKEPAPDYEKMRLAISGELDRGKKESAG